MFLVKKFHCDFRPPPQRLNSVVSKLDWLTDWLTDLLATDWLTGWLNNWLTDWLTTNWLTTNTTPMGYYWLTDWLTVWLTNFQATHSVDRCEYALKKIPFDYAQSSLCFRVISRALFRSNLKRELNVYYIASLRTSETETKLKRTRYSKARLCEIFYKCTTPIWQILNLSFLVK